MQKNSTRQRIIYVITKSNWGGAQRYVFDLATTMAASYDVTVLLGGDGPLAQKLESHKIHVQRMPELERDVHPLKDFKTFIALYTIFKKIRPDVVHLNSSKIGGLGALAARIARIPAIIFTAHGWAFNEDRPLYQKITMGVLYWITILFTHKTIVVSEALKNQISWFPLIQEHLILIHNGIEATTLSTKKTARASIFNNEYKEPDANTLVIGSVGELHPIKGHLYAIEAIAKLHTHHKIHYTIIGEGYSRTILEKKIKELNAEEYIILRGHVHDIAKELKAFDIFILPSLSEALAYVVLEAGLAELPVVCTSVGGVPEIVDDMQSGILIQPKKPREIESAIELLIEHPELKERYARALKEKVLQKFSLKKMLRSTEQLYKNLMHSIPTEDQETHSS